MSNDSKPKSKVKHIRVEGGPLQFAGDWPGVFFRGDDAMHKAFTLERILSDVPENPKFDEKITLEITVQELWVLQHLYNDFASCGVFAGQDPENLQRMIPAIEAFEDADEEIRQREAYRTKLREKYNIPSDEEILDAVYPDQTPSENKSDHDE